MFRSIQIRQEMISVEKEEKNRVRKKKRIECDRVRKKKRIE